MFPTLLFLAILSSIFVSYFIWLVSFTQTNWFCWFVVVTFFSTFIQHTQLFYDHCLLPVAYQTQRIQLINGRFFFVVMHLNKLAKNNVHWVNYRKKITKKRIISIVFCYGKYAGSQRMV